MNLEKLKELNPQIEFYDIKDKKFEYYGKILKEYDFTEVQEYIKNNTPIPEDGNIYVASDKALEEIKIIDTIKNEVYGEMPIEAGYCNGRNSTLNGLEYHKCSEVNIAVTDLVLLLAKTYEIEDNSIDVKRVKAFFVPKGTAFEVFSTTLHFGPCKVCDEGFKLVVILTEGTNCPLTKKYEAKGENQLLFAKNKWLLAHPQRKPLMEKGAHAGIIGENIQIIY